VEFRGESLIARAIRTARDAGASPVFVVLGANHQQIRAALPAIDNETHILIHEAWASGIASSIAIGVAAAESIGADNLLLLTCDQITVTDLHLKRLVETSHHEHIVASCYLGRRGIPAFFPRFAFASLQRLTGDVGARELLQATTVLNVPLSGGEFDIDTPSDLQQMRDAEHQAVLESRQEDHNKVHRSP
jgi:CTP:molybdopterin cytidylyltransferase MocA